MYSLFCLLELPSFFYTYLYICDLLAIASCVQNKFLHHSQTYLHTNRIVICTYILFYFSNLYIHCTYDSVEDISWFPIFILLNNRLDILEKMHTVYIVFCRQKSYDKIETQFAPLHNGADNIADYWETLKISMCAVCHYDVSQG